MLRRGGGVGGREWNKRRGGGVGWIWGRVLRGEGGGRRRERGGGEIERNLFLENKCKRRGGNNNNLNIENF